RRGNPVATRERQGKRLFAQHMQAAVKRRLREVWMEGVRRRDDDGIEAERQQAADVGMYVLEAVALAQRLAHRRGSVRQRNELEPLALLPQIERMLRLPHQAGADQADA